MQDVGGCRREGTFAENESDGSGVKVREDMQVSSPAKSLPNASEWKNVKLELSVEKKG